MIRLFKTDRKGQYAVYSHRLFRGWIMLNEDAIVPSKVTNRFIGKHHFDNITNVAVIWPDRIVRNILPSPRMEVRHVVACLMCARFEYNDDHPMQDAIGHDVPPYLYME